MQTAPLAALIAQHTPREGSHPTAIPDLFLSRSSTTEVPRQTLDRAVFCVVAQGAKSLLAHGDRLRYDPSRFLIVSLDLPLAGQIEEASPAKPYLGFSLVLDPNEISSLLHDPAVREARQASIAPAFTTTSSLGIGTLDPGLLDAVTRLAGLLATPRQIPVLAPLIRRELLFRLLLSDQGHVLERIAAEDARAQRIAAGLNWLRSNALRPIRMEELARELHMSPSTMHSWFRSVTSLSPLQFQKQLRLQEARRLMLAEALDASSASRRVGYESPSQFSREYRRLFGAAPVKDIDRLRRAADPVAVEAV